ncbi:TetR/AcrR family transcriptional regulator [Williamsia maris]|uniref:Transcriptional regulator, TetR family n=1 Tax=Williamsia maris TaxID=72806 RepID=A0ABT1HI84_9NOCA|nr:TetR/AcrR family transcriptional regulator [Williamsia maris]MCP2177150.1 transcriptional regulator, TetR family [Williamsia maris]
MPSTRRKTARLTADDWIAAAFDLLTSDGVAAVKVVTLCQRLKVTKGSFYWHFTDINALFEAMAGAWTDESDSYLRGLTELGTAPPAERIEQMTKRLVDHRTWARESAVREWARSNPTVATAVAALDNRIFEVVQDTLVELGLGAADARIRAGLLVYAGIGFVESRGSLPTPTPDQIHKMIEIIFD